MNDELVALDASRSSLKLVDTGTISIQAPATSSTASNIVTVPHGLGTSDLVWAVVSSTSDIYSGTRYLVTPYSTPDGRVQLMSFVDSNNLYIKATSSTAGSPQPATNFTCRYFIIMP